MPLPILFRQDDLIAIDKPAGIAVIPGRGETTSILEMLADQLGLLCSGAIDPRVRVIHRLDKDTSGVVLYALTTAAQRFVSHQFQTHTVQKEYLALVAGNPPTDDGIIES
ncbi:MAG: RNA pseudouridine synthase, partial [Phycisphaerae bacterium]|nr:RNA pseudouridine synthase [Phycisphaerae bacterium]